MDCPSCNHDNRAERRFCAECGAALVALCAACGASNEPGEKFCGGCGERLRPVVAAPAISLPAPEPEATLPAGERRQLTVLFCDLVGSTPLSQQLDAEEWRDLIAQYQQAASGAVARFGGHVAKNLGDGLLIYFGWPTAREDDPERAVRAGLAIVDAMVPLNATLAAADGTRLAVRIGMHTGPVVIADGGEVFGETANVAARVQGAAEPDTVVITAATQRLVAGLFVVEDRGPQMLKGVREPVTLYRIVQPSGVRSRLDVAAGHLTRFVGREVELTILVDRWERAQDGEGQTVVVLGEAGVGKSRLVYQLHEHLAAVPHTWLECGATPYTEGTPFHPVIALVAQGLAFAPEDTVAEQLGKLEVGLGALASPETVALLADFLGLPPPALLQMRPELQRRKTIDLLVQWTLPLSAAQPLVVFVEDLHWCDASTLELLGHLIAQSPTARVLLLATARPEFTPPWPARSNLTTVQLPRLTNRQARDMVTALGGPELPTDTLDALVTRADGVPLYVEELTKAMAEPGAARGVEAIPATLADSLMARLDRLSTAKEVAQRAAVLGREFGYPLLAATAGLDEAALRHGLARLVDAEILFARGEPPASTYTFKHALIQETAYQSLLKRTRQQLHARIAAVLLKGGSTAAPPAVLAYHWEAAGVAEAAVAAWQQAAEQAQRNAAVLEAEAHYRRALAALAALPDGPARLHIELPLQVALFTLLTLTRGPGDAATEESVARAAALAEQLGDATQAVLVLAGTWAAAHSRNEHRAGLAIARQMERLCERDGGALAGVMTHLCIAVALIHLGELDAGEAHLEQVLALFNDDDFRWFPFNPKVMALAYLAYEEWLAGRPDSAHQREQEAAIAATQRGVLSDVANAQACAMAIAGLRRESAGLDERARRFLKLCTENDLPLFLAPAQVFGGWVLACEGSPVEGIALLRDGLRCEQEAGGNKTILAVHLSLLAEVHAQGGALTEALATLDEAFAALGDEEIWRPDLLRLRGDLLRQTVGSPQMSVEPKDAEEEAQRCYHEAIERARGMGAKAFELRATTRLGRLLRDQGKREEARALLVPIYNQFTEGFDTRDLKDAQALLEEL